MKGMRYKYRFLENGAMKYEGIMGKMFSFVNEEQLLNVSLWKSFVNVFNTKEDGEDLRWRGEYWGKMMRGACLCYKYENDEKLYSILKATMEDMLKTQEDNGRFSTYYLENEFQSWDMWSRKYILTSLLHFYDICKENDLKVRILEAVRKHADYILEHVGNEKGKKKITETSHWWLGVNSSSILEPFVNLYEVTNDKKYLDFAKYIIDEGGIQNGNLIDCVRNDELKPCEYPENKAYETMSFFEGVLEYSLVTDNQELFDIALKFFEMVYEEEVSITGNAGAEDEIFNHGALKQTEKPTRFMQETCVTVTWIRILSKLLLLTGDVKYYDRLEISQRNAMLGSINFDHQKAYGSERNEYLEGLPFDSYSPLYNSRRGLSTGGLNYMKDGSHYGCCACIGSAGIGLCALDTIIEDDTTLLINDYYEGKISLDGINISITGDYLRDGLTHIEIDSSKNKTLKLRIGEWANKALIRINGNEMKGKSSSYFSTNIKKGRYTIDIDFNWGIVSAEINNKIAYMYGPIVLALDKESNQDLDFDSLKASDIHSFEQIELKDSQIAFKAKAKDKEILFKDYASSGKHWDNPDDIMTVWINK